MSTTINGALAGGVIIGQEAICPDGLGRVVSFNLSGVALYIKIDTYINNRSCSWAPHNVTLIEPYPESNR